MTTAILVVAAGRGTRAGAKMPKQWCTVAGKTVARWTLEKFARFDRCVMVIHPDDSAQAAAATEGLNVTLVHGGADRAASVLAGLTALNDAPPANVLIHDVARPCVDPALIDDIIDALQTYDGAAAAVPVTDALWTGADGEVTGTKDRSNLHRAQTPQGFRFDAILKAHQTHPGGAADDVQVARDAGLSVAIVAGSENNLKITGPGDFARAARILETGMDIRLGNGFDVHAFEPGDHVTICGVHVPHDRALKGHSDADVGMHAVTDAIYGALAMGDIGRHFPPSDPEWKDCESHVFLKHAVEMAREKGYEIGNVDCTLICERPKIGPHAAAMMERMAEIMSLRSDQVSVKATTSERLGFTGREEGIAALATATLVRA